MRAYSIGVWLKIKQEGLRRFWSMFLLTRVDLGTGFLSHCHFVWEDAVAWDTVFFGGHRMFFLGCRCFWRISCFV